jgi:hypothetical protein
MDGKGINNRAQLTLFIILGTVLVVSVFLIFTLYNPEINVFRQKTSSPAEYLSNCIESSIKDYEESFFESPTSLNEGSLWYKYNKQSVPFLCYSSEFYFPCTPQNPLFIEGLRKNMENQVSRELSRCILALKEDYEGRGYVFDYSSFVLSLVFNELDISYHGKMSILMSKGDEEILVSSREGRVGSMLPKILRTAETIVNYESVFCEFNYMTWQAIDRGIVISRARGGDQTKVYTLKDRNSDNEIKFAIRTCVLPAGI